ncbi:MAG: S-layer homology domain-containing protein, partial [Oscillospiraceae bacterium]|nr:S-layer homology domain-containing protein [Oscillospiraceae bacterium]
TAESLTVTMSAVPQNANTVRGEFSKEISLTGDKYVLDVTGSPTFSAQDSEGTITGSLKDITITDGVYSISDVTAESLTVTMNAVPQNANTVSGEFSKEISLTGDKYVLDVTGSPTLSIQDGEGTITGSFKDIEIKDSAFAIDDEDTSADSLTVDNASVDAVCPINGSYKEISVEDGKFTLDSRAEAVLTVSGGDGTITGKFYKIVVKGGSVVDDTGDTRVEIDHDMSDVNESAIEVMGGELMFRNDPVITVNSDNTTAVQVTGGKLTMENGSIVAIGVAAKAVSVAKGGEVIFGNPDLNDRVMPSVMTSGGSSIALYVNKNGTATIYRGSIYFDDESSRGIRVTYGGHVKLYPNDEFGTAHPQWQENPHIHIYGGKNASAAIWIDSMASFEIRGRGALIEEPNSNSDSYALYISSGADTDASIIAGGTFNGKIYWDGDDTKSNLNHLIETNHYIRFDGSSADFGWSNGTQGISPDTIDESDTVGSFSGFSGIENEFDGKYTDTVGRRGEYYSVIDAEHELRYAMANGEPYQIPAGIIYQNNENVGIDTDTHRYGYAYDAIELDKNDPTVWAIDKRQGDLDITGDTAIYLAGRRINYYVDFDYSDPDLVSFNDGENDKLHTIAVTDAGTKLTIVSGVFGAEGTDEQLAANEGGYAASGAISYKGYFSKLGDENTSAIKVESGELTITSGILTGGDSGLYITGGKAVIGTAAEDVNNSVILSYAKNQAIRIDGGDVTLNGGANLSEQDGVLVESGTLAVNGGLISGMNQYSGSGIHITGGEVTVTGGALYGNYNTVGGVQSAKDSESGRSLVIDDGTVTVAIDEAHEGYAEDFTLETAKLHHINNIVVNGGTLNYSSARNRNNGALTVTGGTVNYFDGVTVGDTTIYGKEHTEVDDFTTKFFVKDGDFGAFRVTGYNDDNTVAYKTESFRSSVQLHGGYFTSIETDVLLENGQSTIEEIHGAWKKAKFDGENEETRRVNHYVEAVTTARNERGKWNRNNSIQSGTVYSGVSTAAAGEQEAISVRNAVEEFRAWAEGADADTYKLYTNLWIGDSVCDETFCNAEVEAPVDVKRAEAELELNGFGIYGDKNEPESSVLAISGSAAVKGADNSEIRNLSGNAIVVKTGGELTLDNKAVVIGSSAVTNNGTLTVNEATVSGDNAIINTGAATVNENAEIVGKNEAIISSGTLTVENGVITGTMGEGIISSDTLTVNGGAISGKNGITSSGKLTLNGGAVSGESGILSSGTLTVTDGTVTGTAGDGISTSGDFTMESGTVTGTADGVVKTAGTAVLKGGTVSSIKTDGKISDLLDEGLTLSDESGILAGADALARSSIKDGDSSGDEATGGDSVKYDGDEITSVSYETKFTASFSVAERTFTEITLKANDKVMLSIENAKNAALDSDSITNGTATVYLDKTGSAEIKATATAGNSLDSIKVNDKAVSNVAHKKSATVTITAKDSTVTADGKPFGVIIDSVSGITVTKDEAAYKYTVTGKNALKPAVQRMNEQDEWEAFEDAVINKTEEGFEVDLGLDSLDSDYRIKAYIVINTAPTSYVITTDEAENGEIESSADSDNAGASVELTLTPYDGYIPVSVEIRDTNDNEVEAELVDGKYVFTMPASDVTVKATFTKKVSRIFDDVSEEDWFDPAVQYCYDNGLIKGTAENLFSPAFDTTRGMIVTILYRIEKEPAVVSLADFTDVLSGAWYAESVTWAQQNKIVNGYPDGSFGAEDYITREQLAVILYKYAAHKGYDVTAKADVSAYADASEISDWAVGAVEWANANGFMNGYDGKLSPKGFATRAEAAAIIYRFCTSEAVK